jgi:type I restriction-modification system DNA methylase subunit
MNYQRDNKKLFIKTLKDCAAYGDLMRVFSDWLNIAAITVRQAAYHGGQRPKDEEFEHFERLYLEAVKPYSKEQLHRFAEMLATAQWALDAWEGDFLGSVYMELQGDKTRQAAGQFFTPFHVSELMAQIQFVELAEHIRTQGFVTMSEPACGGGGMLIAAAKQCDLHRVDRKLAFFQAIDVSRNCFLMTYVQTSLLGMSGYVIHGDTLRAEQWESWPTPMLQIVQQKAPGFFSWAETIMPMQEKNQPEKAPKQLLLL